MTGWMYLVIAIAFEVAGTTALKASHGFEKLHWGLFAMVCYILCFVAVAPAMKVLPVGVVYAIWAGIGIVGAAAIGLLVFGEKLATIQLAFIALILIGAIGLRATTEA